MAVSDYVATEQAWRWDLDAQIRGDRGLLSLCGLFPLQPGVNTVGSSPDCAICLPKPVPRLLGALELAGGKVLFCPDIGQTIDFDGSLIRTDVSLPILDPTGNSTLRSGNVVMALAQEGGQVALRVWDIARARDFPPRTWFPIEQKYKIRAVYSPYPVPVRLRIPTSSGEAQDGYVQGYLTFRLDGRTHRLDAAEADDGTLFVQFRDQSNGAETYPHGRYVVTGIVQEDGEVVVDFNRSTNPPSAFTEFTTCTLAPKDALLNRRLEAGEKFLGDSRGLSR
jgi:uncharacterized protein